MSIDLAGLGPLLHNLVDLATGDKANLSPTEAAAHHAAIDAADTPPSKQAESPADDGPPEPGPED
jgi:hypothetical protein